MFASIKFVVAWGCIIIPWVASLLWIFLFGAAGKAATSDASHRPVSPSEQWVEAHPGAPFVFLALALTLIPGLVAALLPDSVLPKNGRSLAEIQVAVMEIRFWLDGFTVAFLLLQLATTEGATSVAEPNQLTSPSASGEILPMEILYRRDPVKYSRQLAAIVGLLLVALLVFFEVGLYKESQYEQREDGLRYRVTELAGEYSRGGGCATIVERAFKQIDSEAQDLAAE